MTTNKEIIENLEAGLGGLQDNMMGINNKLQHLEFALSKISEALSTEQETTPINKRSGQSSNGRTRAGLEWGRPMFHSKLANLDFPKYSGEDPTEWVTRVGQFF